MTNIKSQTDNIALAIGAITLGVFALSLGDALIKFSASSFGLWQVFLLRSFLAGGLLTIGMALFARTALFHLRHPLWTLLRSVLLAGSWIALYSALPFVPLSVAAAGVYTTPIFIALFSSIAASERITRYGWGAVVIGFCGITLILKPQSGDVNGYLLLPLLAAILYATAMVMTRIKCQGESPLTLSLWLHLAFITAGGAGSLIVLVSPVTSADSFLWKPWSAMDLAAWGTMAIMALGIFCGSLGVAVAYQKAPPAVVGVFDFTYVGFSAIWGWILFSELPDAWSALGIVLIITAGLMVLYGQSGRTKNKTPAKRPGL